MQVIESMEQALLGLLFAGYELYIIQEQDIRATIFVSEVLAPSLSDSADELVSELLGCDVHDPRAGFQGNPAYSMQKMGLPQSHTAINEQGVIAIARVLSHSQSSSMGQTIAASHNK
jgi:hypothetical protein